MCVSILVDPCVAVSKNQLKWWHYLALKTKSKEDDAKQVGDNYILNEEDGFTKNTNWTKNGLEFYLVQEGIFLTVFPFSFPIWFRRFCNIFNTC